MPDNNDDRKNTDRDYRPASGQESNVNWDDNTNLSKTDDPQNEKGANTRVSNEQTNEQTNTAGYGSSQRDKDESVGPLDADFEQLPSEKRRDRGSNLTGPGLG